MFFCVDFFKVKATREHQHLYNIFYNYIFCMKLNVFRKFLCLWKVLNVFIVIDKRRIVTGIIVIKKTSVDILVLLRLLKLWLSN